MSFHILKVPVILGTIGSPMVIYFLFENEKIPFNFKNILFAWVIIVACILVCKLITDGKEKAHEYGKKIGRRIFENSKMTQEEVYESESNRNKTFIQEIVELEYLGEYIIWILILIPSLIISLILNVLTQSPEIKTWWKLVLVSIVTLLWVIFLEIRGKVIICMPIIHIPVKWFIIPLALLMLLVK